MQKSLSDKFGELHGISRYFWGARSIIFFTAGVFAMLGVVLYFLMGAKYTATATFVFSDRVLSDADIKSSFGGLVGFAGIGGAPSGDDSTKYLSMVKSLHFSKTLVGRSDVKPLVISEFKNSNWLTKLVPTGKDDLELLDLARWFHSIWEVAESDESGLYELSVDWSDPVLAKNIANIIFTEANIMISEQERLSANALIKHMQPLARAEKNEDAKQVLYEMVDRSIRKAVLAGVSENYAFQLIDPAYEPEKASSPSLLKFSTFCCALGALSALIFLYVRFVFYNYG